MYLLIYITNDMYLEQCLEIIPKLIYYNTDYSKIPDQQDIYMMCEYKILY